MAGITIYIYLPPKVEISLSSLTHTFLSPSIPKRSTKMLQKSLSSLVSASHCHWLRTDSICLIWVLLSFLTGLPPSVSTYLLPCWHISFKKNLTWSTHYLAYELSMAPHWIRDKIQITIQGHPQSCLHRQSSHTSLLLPLTPFSILNFLFFFQHFMIFHTLWLYLPGTLHHCSLLGLENFSTTTIPFVLSSSGIPMHTVNIAIIIPILLYYTVDIFVLRKLWVI